jgi:hypothetical protein
MPNLCNINAHVSPVSESYWQTIEPPRFQTHAAPKGCQKFPGSAGEQCRGRHLWSRSGTETCLVRGGDLVC